MSEEALELFAPDRVEIVAVRPFETKATSIWPCTRCGWHHRANESWSVDVRMTHSSAERSHVVCPNCAEELRARTD